MSNPAARIDGVDFSHWQAGTVVNYTKARRSGVRFMWHKATESTTYVDASYGTRRQQSAGHLTFGAYHFARPSKTDGKTQAQFFLRHATVRKGDLRPALDLEDSGGLGIAALTAWAGKFVAEVEHQTGEKPFIYTPFDLNNNFDCPLWVARYSDAMSPPRVPKPWKTWTVWQFSNGVYGSPTSAPGIGGKVDLNTLNTSTPGKLLAKFIVGATDPAPTPSPVKRYPNADAVLKAAKAGEAISTGHRHAVFANIATLAKSIGGK